MSIYSFLLSIIMAITTLCAPLATPIVTENKADDFVPVMRFVATSDAHVITPGDMGSTRIT